VPGWHPFEAPSQSPRKQKLWSCWSCGYCSAACHKWGGIRFRPDNHEVRRATKTKNCRLATAYLSCWLWESARNSTRASVRLHYALSTPSLWIHLRIRLCSAPRPAPHCFRRTGRCRSAATFAQMGRLAAKRLSPQACATGTAGWELSPPSLPPAARRPSPATTLAKQRRGRHISHRNLCRRNTRNFTPPPHPTFGGSNPRL